MHIICSGLGLSMLFCELWSVVSSYSGRSLFLSSFRTLQHKMSKIEKIRREAMAEVPGRVGGRSPPTSRGPGTVREPQTWSETPPTRHYVFPDCRVESSPSSPRRLLARDYQNANPNFWTKGYGRTTAHENARKTATARRTSQAGGARSAPPACDPFLSFCHCSVTLIFARLGPR